MDYILQNTKLKIKINSLGAELTEIINKENNLSYLWDANPLHWKRHSPVLFPNVGKYYNGKYIYNGKEYFGNSLFYTTGNSNWRLQLKGEAADGSKLTDISRPCFGLNGGFADKILLFHKLSQPNTYELSIVSMDERNVLIDASSEWAGSGMAGKGREYGFIKPQA